MVNTILRAKRMAGVNCSVHLEKEASVQVKSTYEFNVKFSIDNSKCLAFLTQSVECPENPKKLSVSVSVEGQFDCEGIESDEGRKEVHIQAYDKLFPYMQSLMDFLFTNAGLPPLKIEKADLKAENVRMQD